MSSVRTVLEYLSIQKILDDHLDEKQQALLGHTAITGGLGLGFGTAYGLLFKAIDSNVTNRTVAMFALVGSLSGAAIGYYEGLSIEAEKIKKCLIEADKVKQSEAEKESKPVIAENEELTLSPRTRSQSPILR